MKQITVNIPDNKLKAFAKLIRDLGYVQVVDNSEIKSIHALQQSLNQVGLMREGKIPKQSIQDFLDEL